MKSLFLTTTFLILVAFCSCSAVETPDLTIDVTSATTTSNHYAFDQIIVENVGDAMACDINSSITISGASNEMVTNLNFTPYLDSKALSYATVSGNVSFKPLSYTIEINYKSEKGNLYSSWKVGVFP